MNDLNENQIAEIVAASVDGWELFIQTGLNSDFYIQAKQFLDSKTAARITLLHLYLSTFSNIEKDQMLTDVDYFLRYTDGFLRELLPHKKRNLNFLIHSKRVFKQAMRSILSQNYKTVSDAISYAEKCDFLRGSFQLTSSVEVIIQSWDEYKEYLFRHQSQLHVQKRA